MTKREKQTNNYPHKYQDYSYGCRYWNGEKWLYWGSKWSKKKGHVEQWLNTDCRCWTTTSLLSAMFKAQELTCKEKIVIEVVRFQEPTVAWIAWYKNRSLQLESMEKNVERFKNEYSK